MKQKHPYNNWLLYGLLLRIHEFEEKMKSIPHPRTEAVQWILSKIGEISVLKIMKGMQEMPRSLAEIDQQLSIWDMRCNSPDYYDQISQDMACFFTRVYKELALFAALPLAMSVPPSQKNILDIVLKTVQILANNFHTSSLLKTVVSD